MPEIKILSKPYTVTYVDEDTLSGHAGDANLMRQSIRISKDQGVEQKKDTLLHECIHAVSRDLKLDLAEELIHRLACGIFTISCVEITLPEEGSNDQST